MANEFVTFNPYDEQIEKLRQRQKMADLLQQQALQPLESQVAPGGYAVRTSPVLGLAKMLQAYMGGREQSNIDKELTGIREQMAYDQRQKEAEVASAGQAMMGRLTGERPTKPTQRTPTLGAANFDELGYEEAAPTGPRPIQIGANATFAPRSIEEAGKRTIESNQLGEITPTAQYQYQYDPSGALQMAMTPTGMEAMKGNPLLASLLAQMVKPKEPEKFGTTPVRGADGKYYLVSESGRMVPTNVAGFDKEATQTNLGKLYAERDALLPNDPRRKEYDKAIANALQPNTGTNISFGGLVPAKDAEGNTVLLQASSQGGVRKVEGFTPAAPSGNSASDISKHRESKLELQNAMDVVTKFSQSLSSIPKEESIVGAKAGELASNYKLALGAIRKLQNTGVLNPGELPFIEDTLRNPQSISQLFNPQSRKEIEGQIKAITSALELQNKNLDESFSYDYRPLKGSRSTW